MSLPFNKGFTLIELLVSVAIMVVITTVVVSNESNFSDEAALKNTADSISLALREAQTYGISVREAGAGSNNFVESYGVEFNTRGSLSSKYVLFTDSVTKNGAYNSGTPELISSDSYGNNNIGKICSIMLDGTKNCPPGGSSPYIQADVTFTRPNTRANIYLNQILQTGIKGICVPLSAASNSSLIRYINIYTTGQVSIGTQCQ
ncbi:prepilin-type N-terminal cleavage/methylation domain-containing protein [Candidatus Parcubacteria bacterium]|nr:prepilin-type N-terminal cleavage/methylation domain-containing protein [Candidatus Parcubacteria bacterium]